MSKLESLNFTVNSDNIERREKIEENLAEALSSKFQNIFISHNESTQDQITSLTKIEKGFLYVQSQIDPDRLDFNYTIATDNEICLSRKSDNGISNIIIDTDGTIAYSFISFKNSDKRDILIFFQDILNLDEENIVFKFLSL